MKTGERGKPYSAAHPEIRFNISHCETACACVIGEGELGIDIERKFSYRENLARKVCHPEEWKMLQTLDEAQRSHQLHLLWSLKESFVKWQGQGLSYGMERVCFAEVLPLGITQRQEEPMHFTVTYSGKIEPCTEAAKRCAEKVDEAGAYGISRAEALEIARQLHFLVKDASAYTLAVCAEQVPDASAIIYKKERELL
jgi:phosphopantetheinyl transferase (holo-ACP synthase)